MAKWRYLLPIALLLASGSAPADNTPDIVVSGTLAPPPASFAPIALLADLSSGQVLFARAADKRFLPASMTKAMTALIAFDLIAAGKLDENAVVTVRPETAARWAGRGTTLNLRPGETVRVGDLLMGTTTVSANDAAVALAEAAMGSKQAFIAAMNTRAAGLGMKGSRFGTPNGMPDMGKTQVTANDLIRLATALITEHPQRYRKYFGQKSMIWRGGRYDSHDPFAGVLPGADGIKTGHTREAGFNFLGAVDRGGRRLVVVIGGAPSEPARAQGARALAEWGYRLWDSHAFLSPGYVVGAARVQGGDARQVQLTVPRAFSLAVPQGQAPRVTARIVYDGPLRAPLTKGQQVARLEVSQPGQPSHVLPLVTVRGVGVAGPIDRIGNGLLGLLE
ncbi:D-alanyl-D-alanine carboxypeptidase family protein [Novosphingobium sp.]|uniref:D-alanyl-D-alanine carboxypeptidase family protein n=1 Tax=Novosphingobium sp. TaxID=1874826 RepID=UPI0025D6A97D|nr:D-alanyl-D-alanine carboxypeptidase family protein [Novosphingobium sp.]MCC6924346.1 D-alanyl-D-alanine carboxypeptidase [Novosphingobium sp.]